MEFCVKTQELLRGQGVNCPSISNSSPLLVSSHSSTFLYSWSYWSWDLSFLHFFFLLPPPPFGSLSKATFIDPIYRVRIFNNYYLLLMLLDIEALVKCFAFNKLNSNFDAFPRNKITISTLDSHYLLLLIVL